MSQDDEEDKPTTKKRGPGRPPGSKNKITVEWNQAQKRRYEQLSATPGANGGTSSDDAAFKTPKKPGRKKKKQRTEDDDDTKRLANVAIDDDGILLGGRKRALPLSQVHDKDRSGRSRLFKYASTGDLESCRALISVGIDVNIRDYAGWTALHEACLTGQLEVVECLVKAGANTNSEGGGLDTPLHDAVQNEHFEVVKFLLENGASTTALNEKHQAPLDVAENKRIRNYLIKWTEVLKKVLTRDEKGLTPLHHVCTEGNVGRIKEYIKLGANINAADNAKWTPLHEAALNGRDECVQVLLRHGAFVDCVSFTGDSPLMDACANNYPKCALILLEFGADASLKNQEGKTALDFCRESNDGSEEDRRIILEYLNRDPASWIPHRQPEFKVETFVEAPAHSQHLSSIGGDRAFEEGDKGKHLASMDSEDAGNTSTYRDFSTKSLATWWGADEASKPSSREERKFQALLKTLEQSNGGSELPHSDPVGRRKSNYYEGGKKAASDDDDRRKKRASVPPPIKVSLSSSAAIKPSSTSAGDPVVVKRKRGRPRKNPLPQENIPRVKNESDDDNSSPNVAASADESASASKRSLKILHGKEQVKSTAEAESQPILLKAKKRFSDEHVNPEKLEVVTNFEASTNTTKSSPQKKRRLNDDAQQSGRFKSPEKILVSADKFSFNQNDRRISNTSTSSSTTSYSSEKYRNKSLSVFDSIGEQLQTPNSVPRKKKKDWLGISGYKSRHESSSELPLPGDQQPQQTSVSSSNGCVEDPKKLIELVPPSMDQVKVATLHQHHHTIFGNPAESRQAPPPSVQRGLSPESTAIMKRLLDSKLYTIISDTDDHTPTRSFVDLQVGLLYGLKSGRSLLERFPHLSTRVASAAEKIFLEGSPLSSSIYESMVAQGTNPRWLKTVVTRSGNVGLDLSNLDIQFLKEDEVLGELERVGGRERVLMQVEVLDMRSGGKKDARIYKDIAVENVGGYVHKLMRNK